MNNINNKLINKKEVEEIINKHLDYDVSINNLKMFQTAFIHKSFLVYCGTDDQEDIYCLFDKNFFTQSNERLEFFGDSCLNLITAEYLFDKFPTKDEGFLTKLRTKLVRNTNLSFLGTKLGFNEWLLISPHVEKISGRNNQRLIEDVMESFIACIYKDLGFYTCKDFIFNLFNTYLNIDEMIACHDNYKDTLLRFFQTNNWKHPIYNTVKEEGTAYNKNFITCVTIEKTLVETSEYKEKISMNDSIVKSVLKISDDLKYYICTGEGKTKKESEQNSSKKCLEILKVSFDF